MTDILITDDEPDIRELISDILTDEGFATRMASSATECMDAVRVKKPALLILDIWLKDNQMDGIDVLKQVKRSYPDVPIVIISGHGTIEIAVAAIKQGAYDFIEKPFNIDQLLVVIRRAMETSRLRRENFALKSGDGSAGVMLGESAAFKAMKAQLEKVAKSNGRVMLTGGHGVGKELAARFIHDHSLRAEAPFIMVNGSTLNPQSAETDLFGARTPTGVQRGLLEQASGGTLYFNEVTDLPLEVQSKILRVLVDQKLTRIGETEPVAVDLRIISSSARDVQAHIETGRFRQELYHRLNVVPISVPELVARREDIPLLATHFIQVFHTEQGLPLRGISPEAAAALQTMPWPGNVRQLKNMIERVLILSDNADPVSADEFIENTDGGDKIILSGTLATLPLREARELFEREYLLTQINRFGGNISRTSTFVGMERSALHRKLKSLGVVSSKRDDTDDD